MSLTKSNGNDVVYTPDSLAVRIIEHFKPYGKVLDPAKGKGAFYNNFPDDCFKYWCELSEGRDFFDFEDKVDWVITNPPYSKMFKFLEHAFKLSNNVVYLMLLPNVLQTSKINLAIKYKFCLRELVYIDYPANFPKTGFMLGCAYYSKSKRKTVKITDWRDDV